MYTNFIELSQSLGVSFEVLLLTGVGLGIMVVVWGLSGVLASPGAESRRMRVAGTSNSNSGSFNVIRVQDNDPKGILKALVPKTEKERSVVAKRLRQAGIHGENAVFNFYILRTLLGLLLPSLFIALLFVPDHFDISNRFLTSISKLSWAQSFQILTGLALVGFFGPTAHIKARIAKRRKSIEHGMPNALDLLQVSIEAGLGFDAAMTRVAHELKNASTPISEEFSILQLEIQAGKDRDRAFMDMAERSGVEEMTSFANVVLQSMRFGTSVSEALSGYAQDMRLNRELRAQEKANKLPVKMSAVMAALMMPVLLMICLSPVLIRWLRVMTEG